MYLAKELLVFSSQKLKTDPWGKTRGTGKTKSEQLKGLYLYKKSEQRIASILYGKEDNQNFRQLKSRMVEQTITQLLSNIHRIKFRNAYDKNVFIVQKLTLISNLLLLNDQRKLAEPLLKKAFNIALKLEYTSYLIQIARMLSYSYALKTNQKLFNHYSKIMSESVQIHQKELEIESLYYALLPEITNKTEYSVGTKFDLKFLFFKTKASIERHRSHTLQLLFFRIAVRYYHSLHDFHTVITYCKQALNYFTKNQHFYQNARLGEFSLHEMESCLRLQSYAKGRECADRCIKYLIPYVSTWSIFYEYYFLLAMRTSKFETAIHIYNTIHKSKYKLQKMHSRHIEKWKIYEAYLSFAHDHATNTKQFNLYRYLNEITFLQKDKSGYNYMVIISKILLLFNTRDFDRLIEMEDSFKIYFRRYINRMDYPRHYIFGKFLIQLFKQNFIIENIDPTSFLKSLSEQQLLEETEILPYDALIHMILSRKRFF